MSYHPEDDPNARRGRSRTGSPYQHQQSQPPAQHQSQWQQPPPGGMAGQQRQAPYGQPPQGHGAQQAPGQGPQGQQAPGAGPQRQPPGYGGAQGSAGGTPTPPGSQQAPASPGMAPGGMGAQRPQPRLQPVQVEEIVATDVVTAERSTPVATIVAQMAEQDVGSVVIVENDSPVGIVTDRQIALALESTPDVSERTAADLVDGDLVTGSLDMSVFDALRRLSDADVRRLPIVDEDGTLQGIVTLDDILVLLASELDNAAEVIRSQSPRL